MNKSLAKKFTSDKNLRKELRRAHAIIVLLCIGIGMLVGALIKTSVISQLLGIITISLITLVGLISLFVMIHLTKKS